MLLFPPFPPSGDVLGVTKTVVVSPEVDGEDMTLVVSPEVDGGDMTLVVGPEEGEEINPVVSKVIYPPKLLQPHSV